MDKECEGNCEKHEGEVQNYLIHSTDKAFDGMTFYYCSNAVKSDVKDGFLLEILE